MIRVVQKADITKVADIWLDTNIKAHNFISAQYWESNYELVKECCYRRRSMCVRVMGKYRDL